jgi:hypothetical protein
LGTDIVEILSDWRGRITFSLFFVVVIALLAGALYIGDLARFQQTTAAEESRTAMQGIIEPGQLDQALARYPWNRFLKLIAAETKSANETNDAIDKLSNEIEPPRLAKNVNLGTAGRDELEAIERDVKTAETNSASFMPRYVALFKTEREKLQSYARALNADKDTINRFLDNVDKRQAEATDLVAKMLSARVEFYRAYDECVGLLIREFGSYKVTNGQFIFALQPTANRYNAAARAMTAALERNAELKEERNKIALSQLKRWQQFVEALEAP